MKSEKIVSYQGNILNDPLILRPEKFKDSRGYFLESWNENTFSKVLGKKINFRQDNHSFSYKNVLRGLHYQLPPNPQAKLVRCISGEIFDVIVDIRLKSETFLNWVGIYLNENNQKQIWVPAGFAHGFLTISESAMVMYKTSHYWDKNSERSINFLDEDIKIKWPKEEKDLILSEKDKYAPFIKEIKEDNLF